MIWHPLSQCLAAFIFWSSDTWFVSVQSRKCGNMKLLKRPGGKAFVDNRCPMSTSSTADRRHLMGRSHETTSIPPLKASGNAAAHYACRRSSHRRAHLRSHLCQSRCVTPTVLPILRFEVRYSLLVRHGMRSVHYLRNRTVTHLGGGLLGLLQPSARRARDAAAFHLEQGVALESAPSGRATGRHLL